VKATRLGVPEEGGGVGGGGRAGADHDAARAGSVWRRARRRRAARPVFGAMAERGGVLEARRGG
jgi:hypothetical protein